MSDSTPATAAAKARRQYEVARRRNANLPDNMSLAPREQPATAALRCDCEPTVYDDGSKGHEEECATYPQCPHEVVRAVCFMPCNCSCRGCKRLSEAHSADA